MNDKGKWEFIFTQNNKEKSLGTLSVASICSHDETAEIFLKTFERFLEFPEGKELRIIYRDA